MREAVACRVEALDDVLIQTWLGDDPADICFFLPLPADADVYRLQRPALIGLDEPVGTSISAAPDRARLIFHERVHAPRFFHSIGTIDQELRRGVCRGRVSLHTARIE